MYNKIFIEKLFSTNDYLKDLQDNVEEFTTVYCNEQTKGKGQRGNKWFSSIGKNLTFSFTTYPKIKTKNHFDLNIIISISILEILRKYSKNIKIKWPNDIYINNKKIGGILIENSLSRDIIKKSIIGVGLNINQEKFPKEVPNPTSLFIENNKTYNIENILDEIINKVKYIYSNFNQNKKLYKERYLENLYLLNTESTFEDKEGIFKGIIKNVLDTGEIEILNLDKNIVNNYLFKEVKFLS